MAGEISSITFSDAYDKFNIIDKPNERSSHTRITLRGGGIIFYFGALAYFLTSDYAYPWFMLALTLITVISFVDDICSTSQKLRLIFHFSAMAMMFYQWGLFSVSWYWIVVALIICTGIQCIQLYGWYKRDNGRILTCDTCSTPKRHLAYLNANYFFILFFYL